jgi:hypothetical protein
MTPMTVIACVGRRADSIPEKCVHARVVTKLKRSGECNTPRGTFWSTRVGAKRPWPGGVLGRLDDAPWLSSGLTDS